MGPRLDNRGWALIGTALDEVFQGFNGSTVG